MNHSLTISSPHPDDLSAVVALLRDQLQEHSMKCSLDGLKNVLITLQNEPRYGFILVAKIEGTIVGFAIATLIMSPEHEGLVAWLEEFYVAPSQRGYGVGSALLDSFLHRAREVGVVAIDLEVDADHETVISLYHRFGFEELPRRRFFRRLESLT